MYVYLCSLQQVPRGEGVFVEVEEGDVKGQHQGKGETSELSEGKNIGDDICHSAYVHVEDLNRKSSLKPQNHYLLVSVR